MELELSYSNSPTVASLGRNAIRKREIQGTPKDEEPNGSWLNYRITSLWRAIAPQFPLSTMKLLTLIICLVLPGLLSSCGGSDVPPGQVLIRNDILDREFNEVVIDQVGVRSGGVPFRKVLKPGERSLLNVKGVTRMRFSRKYRDHTNVYHVQCPGRTTEGILIKLIDVHTGRLPGGCSLDKKGKLVQGVMEWDELSAKK